MALEPIYNKAKAAPTPGVFSLDQLRALGQTGDVNQDWLSGAPKDPNALIKGAGRAVLATDIPAGYYQVPGTAGALYYDPHTGQAPKELVDFLNSPAGMKRDPNTGAPPGYIADNGDTGTVLRAQYDQQPGYIKTLTDIFALGRSGEGIGAYQDSQDRVLGLGKYQQYVTGRNGEKIRMSDVAGIQAASAAKDPNSLEGTFTDLGKTQAGAFDRLSTETGLTGAALDKEIGLLGPSTGGGRTADYWLKMENAMAANYETNAQKGQGLAAVRKAQGLDVTTGISDARKKSISDTYNSIQDPGEKAAYIRFQDPGNLTPELRQARYDTRAGERETISASEVSDPNRTRYEYLNSGPGAGGQIKSTIGHQSFTDEATGREVFAGNLPTKMEYVAPRSAVDSLISKNFSKTAGYEVLSRAFGATSNFLVTLATTGQPWYAVARGAMGAGIGLPNFRRVGDWRWGQAQGPGEGSEIAGNIASSLVMNRFKAVRGKPHGYEGQSAYTPVMGKPY